MQDNCPRLNDQQNVLSNIVYPYLELELYIKEERDNLSLDDTLSRSKTPKGGRTEPNF